MLSSWCAWGLEAGGIGAGAHGLAPLFARHHGLRRQAGELAVGIDFGLGVQVGAVGGLFLGGGFHAGMDENGNAARDRKAKPGQCHGGGKPGFQGLSDMRTGQTRTAEGALSRKVLADMEIKHFMDQVQAALRSLSYAELCILLGCLRAAQQQVQLERRQRRLARLLRRRSRPERPERN